MLEKPQIMKTSKQHAAVIHLTIPREEIRQALGMIQESGAVEKARVDARSFGSLAKKALDELPDTEAKGNLLRLVDYVLTRDV